MDSMKGTPLAGGLVCALWCIKGDQDWISNTLHLEHYGARCMCVWCKANTIDDEEDPRAAQWNLQALPFTDVSEQPRWKSTVWADPEAWRVAHGGVGQLHPLFWLPMVSVVSICPDSMHIVDLGYCQHLVANAIFHLVIGTGYFEGQTAEERLEKVWIRIVDHYRHRATPVQLGNLVLSMICNPKALSSNYPCLARVKAAEARHLTPIVRDIFKDHMDPASPVDGHIHLSLDALATYYECLSENMYRLTRSTEKRMVGAIWSTLRHYNCAAVWARENNLKRWNVVPKMHFFAHIALTCRYQNPRTTWNYMDEDFMGIMKEIAEACTSGTPSHKVPKVAATKWGLGVGRRLANGD